MLIILIYDIYNLYFLCKQFITQTHFKFALSLSPFMVIKSGSFRISPTGLSCVT